MMRVLFLKLRRRAGDGLRYSALLRELAGLWTWSRAWMTLDGGTRLARLCRAYALCESPLWRLLLKSLPDSKGDGCWREAVDHQASYRKLLTQHPALTRTVVLKAPGPEGEKGVLLAYFEYNLARLLALDPEGVRWLGEHYHVILAASWSPTDYALLGLAASTLPGPLWVQCAHLGDKEKVEEFHPNIRCLPGLACDWVNPDFYQAKPPGERSIDLLMVANWGGFKRHWEFFEALTQMPEHLRVVLIGQKEGGRTMEVIRQMACEIGVRQALELRESVPIAEVTAMQCDARVSVILSRREGGCVAVVESLMAGSALALRDDAHIGSAAHVNASTGQRLRPGHIAADLMKLLDRSVTMDPRTWAAANISCHFTLASIQAAIKHADLAQGRPWTQNLAAVHWRPYPVHIRAEDRDRLRPAYEELHRRFPQVFATSLMEDSVR